MGVRKQKVELYYDGYEAKKAMRKQILNGWFVHSCTMSCYMTGYTPSSQVLVVYEKEEPDER